VIIHGVNSVYGKDVEFICSKKSHYIWPTLNNLPENCYYTEDGFAYSFKEECVTCEKCLEKIKENNKLEDECLRLRYPWIDINLPYKLDVELPRPEFNVDINAKVMEKFGYTEETLFDNYKLKYGVNAWIRENVLEQELTQNHPELSKEDAIDAAQKDTNPDLIEIKELYKKNRDIQEFIQTIPEIIEFGKVSSEVIMKEHELCTNGSFKSSKYNRPGVLIEVQKKYAIERYLIGDINEHSDEGGEWNEIEDDDIVLRACELLSEDFLLKMKEL